MATTPTTTTGNRSPAAGRFGFDSDFLAQLERVALINRHAVAGSSAGPRRSRIRGSSVEFADYRDYHPGDDYRRVDWNAYARLDRLFLRLYMAEQMTAVTIFLDRSLSMQFGEPSKALCASRLAAILSFVGLTNYDSVKIVGWGGGIEQQSRSHAGRAAVPNTWRSIEEIMSTTSAETDFKALGRYRPPPHRRGLAIVLSDFLTASDWRAGLRALRAGGQEVNAVQILAPEEIEPRFRGDWSLVDAESGARVEVTMTPRLLGAYKDELASHVCSLRAFCRKQQIGFTQLTSEATLATNALRDLRAAGILR